MTTTIATDTEAGNPQMELIPIPADSLTCLLACGAIVQELIFRCWENLDNSNENLMRAASFYGLQLERPPTDEEMADGVVGPGDIMLELSPVFAATMDGLASNVVGMEDEASDEAPEAAE